MTEFVMPWNLFHLTARDTHYGLCKELKPWTPVARGKVVQLVCQLTDGMSFVECRPKELGRFVLEGAGRKLWVWQNRKAWTPSPGTSFTIEGLPANAAKLRVYGWEGLRQTIPLTGKRSVQIRDLSPGETYMFLAGVTRRDPIRKEESVTHDTK